MEAKVLPGRGKARTGRFESELQEKFEPMGLRLNIIAAAATPCRDQLEAYAAEFPVWDPMLTHDGENWFLYLLSTTETSNRDNFFTRDNLIRGFVSRDLDSWQDIGTVIPAGFYGKRICAGSLHHDNGRFYFFCSATMEQFSSELLDQRIFLATSTDGRKFEIEEGFSLEPDPALYGTKAWYPDSDRMMYAWRDPYVFRDPVSGKFYLFICAGGDRWGAPPKIAVAEADSLAGPYRLLPAAAKSLLRGPNGADSVPVREMERVQVSYRNGRYCMMFSVWEHFMDEAWKQSMIRRGGVLSGSATVVLWSDSVTGPYRFDDSATLIEKPPGANLYGAMNVSSPDPARGDFVVGWYPENFKPEVSSGIRIDWEGQAFRVEPIK